MILPQIKTTTGDKALIVSLLVFAGALVVWGPSIISSKGEWVRVLVDNEVVGVYSLNDNRTITLKGPLGDTEVIIEDGRARILSSPCPGKHCIMMGSIDKQGGALICAPNKVVVISTDRGQTRLDAVTR